jgi:hypothetical protein
MGCFRRNHKVAAINYHCSDWLPSYGPDRCVRPLGCCQARR